MQDKIKVGGKTGNLGDLIRVTREKAKLGVAADTRLSKRYLKYLSKKYLKKQQVPPLACGPPSPRVRSPAAAPRSCATGSTSSPPQRTRTSCATTTSTTRTPTRTRTSASTPTGEEPTLDLHPGAPLPPRPCVL